ncbi:DUF3784 domain-containing protein [Corallibacter sp.]|uniref:DUF3784 domain-containing protein n=1 Tax=Corallibacter sp. TaxID=2038084 RepID=UPI003AB4BE15
MIFTAALFILIGIVIKHGKMYNLIAGYNTMSPEEKAKYDIEKIATLFRNVMIAMAVGILISYGLASLLNIPKIKIFGMFTSILIGLPYLLIMSNSKKYRK